MGLSRKKGAPPVVTYTGKAGLNRFASIDRKNANDFLKWDALLLDNLEVGVNPTRLSIDQISLADFFARVIVDPDGSVNLVTMFNNPEAAPTPGTGETDISEPAPKPTTQPAPTTEQTTCSHRPGHLERWGCRFFRPVHQTQFQRQIPRSGWPHLRPGIHCGETGRCAPGRHVVQSRPGEDHRSDQPARSTPRMWI